MNYIACSAKSNKLYIYIYIYIYYIFNVSIPETSNTYVQIGTVVSDICCFLRIY